MNEEIRNVFDRISDKYYELTDTERKVADYVAVHQWDVQLMSISELAESCGVAEATITRFCRRLGYKGYYTFKLAMAHAGARPVRDQMMLEGVRDDDPIPVLAEKLCAACTDALEQTVSLLHPEAISQAADLLLRSKNVLCLGQGGSALLAMECAHRFSTALPGYRALVDSHIQSISISHLTSQDTVMFFSYSGSTRESVELLPLARDQGASVILVTRFPKSPAAAYADVILQCGSNELPLQHGSIPARMSQLLLVDLLYTEVCRRDRPRTERVKDRVASILAGKHL